MLSCDTEGTETSVSYEFYRAALVFTGCVIFFCRLFIMLTVRYIAKNWDRGVEAYRMHEHL